MASPPRNTGLSREILAVLDGMNQRLTETRELVTEVRSDAREARDATTRLTERFDAQDVPTKLAELKSDMEKGFAAARSDLVNSSDKIRTELSAHNDRLKALEDFRAKIEGGAGVFSWVAKNAPWLLTALLAAAAALGWKDRVG